MISFSTGHEQIEVSIISSSLSAIETQTIEQVILQKDEVITLTDFFKSNKGIDYNDVSNKFYSYLDSLSIEKSINISVKRIPHSPKVQDLKLGHFDLTIIKNGCRQFSAGNCYGL